MPRPSALPSELSPRELGLRCREAGLDFLEGAASGWGKRDLAEWLIGPYRALAQRRDARGPVAATKSVAEQTIASLIDLTRIGVASTISELGTGEWHTVLDAIQNHSIEPARAAGELIWLPIDQPRMRLETRVLSLFLVDYLLEPEVYERDVSFCDACFHVAFDGAGRACSRCEAESRPSFVRRRGASDEEITEPMLPRPVSVKAG
jgi:hypothetical protein